jgi:hypothetical protein
LDLARNHDDEGQDVKPGKQGIVLFLEAWDTARSLPADRALALAEAGTPPTGSVPLARCAHLLPPPTAAALLAWANALPASARACFAALYQGSGAGANRKLVRLRRLTGADGLRPIRVRLVAYLVAPLKARALAPEIAAALAAIAPAAGGGAAGGGGAAAARALPRAAAEPEGVVLKARPAKKVNLTSRLPRERHASNSCIHPAG